LDAYKFEDVAWYEPHQEDSALPEFYRVEWARKNPAAYVCPFCDQPLNGEDLKEFLKWKQTH